MILAPGVRLGPYEIEALIGAGGMGEVYRARDTRLDRSVAVKILSATLSSPEARQRFEREARTISQLSHPHICALFDVGEAPAPRAARSPESPASSAQPLQFLVMELLEGETLADRLAGGPLPFGLTIRYAMEIADALDKAHRQGIVHRDLKPANIMVTKSGVKLLDFGLAKAAAPLVPSLMSVAQTTPHVRPLTAQGAIAGTVQYMAPEQLEGCAADARSDIFALGAVTYEMATGSRAFRTAQQQLTPEALDRVVRGCLTTDPDERWQSAHDVGLQLRAIAAGPLLDGASGDFATASAAPRPQRRIGWLPWAIAASAVVVAAALGVRRSAPDPPARPEIVRFSVPPPPNGAFYDSFENTGLSVSPDGSQIAFTGHSGSEPRRIWIRAVQALESKPIAGTDGATSLFWSPDGRSLAFFAGTRLRRIDLRGGAPVSICDVRDTIGWSGTWGADGQILFSSIEGEAIWTVPAGGGVPAALLKPDAARGEARLNWPYFLPDGRRLLYLQRRRDGSGRLMLLEPGVGSREVMPLQSSAQYVDPGYLVFAAEGALVGQRFDLSRAAVIGEPFSIADSVGYFFTTTVARFAVSRSGTLVYTPHNDEQRLGWFARSGRDEGTLGPRGHYQRIRFSPDGRRVAFSRLRAGALDVWQTDLERQIETRLTFRSSSENPGPWMPDARSLFFDADLGAPPEIFRKNLATGEEESVLPASGTLQESHDVSPDGRHLLFTQRAAGTFDVWQFPLDGSGSAAAIAVTPFDELGPRFSPDGRFFSFSSNVSGRFEVYVAPFPPTGEQFRVSTDGGRTARWAGDGRELLYLSADGRVTAVPIRTSPALSVGKPIPLFEMKRPWLGFEVSSAGRLLAIVPEMRAADEPLTAVLNWTTGIAK
jgi:eukaryotic-like serine/threonine-protein kinase